MGDKKPFSTPNAYARNRRGAKIAGIVGGLCVAAVGVVSLMAFMVPSTGFVVQVNYQKQAQEAAKLRLRGNKSAKGSESEDKQLAQGSSILVSEQMKNAVPGTAEDVLDFLAVTELDGAQAIPHMSEGKALNDGYNIGMAYTFYLSNTSENPIMYDFGISYSNHVASTDASANSLLSYLRILVVVDDGNAISHNWYAMASSTKNDEGNYLEAISTYDSNSTPRVANFSDGDTRYCTAFDMKNQKLCTLNQLTVGAGKETRFTVVVYPEGEDPECNRNAPKGESLAIFSEFSVWAPEE